MKRIILTTLLMTSLISSQALARNTGQTTIIGGATGAVLGQAIGRNTEGTLIGTALGSIIGYMVGNEMDKENYSSRHRAARISRPVRTIEPQYRYIYQEYDPEPVCRETEILATIDGRPEIITAIACLEDGRWIIDNSYNDQGRKNVVINNFNCYKARKKNRKRHRHYQRQVTNYNRGNMIIW